jgi:multidrug transporter EmrE-like cation transporter
VGGSLPWLRVLSVWRGIGYLGVFIAGYMWFSRVEFTVGVNSGE